MEEDIQNHSTTVMFRGTPCSSKVQRFAFFPSTFMPYSVYFMTEKKEWFLKQGRRREATKLHKIRLITSSSWFTCKHCLVVKETLHTGFSCWQMKGFRPVCVLQCIFKLLKNKQVYLYNAAEECCFVIPEPSRVTDKIF